MKTLSLLIVLIAAHCVNAQVDSVFVAGVHPWAAKQRTASGKSIKALFAWKDRIYAGYGDYGANTGPITIAPFDPVTRTFDSVYAANTEAIYNIREIRGRLYAPAIDRKTYATPGDYAMLDTNGVWSDRNCGSSTHAFDVATLTPNDVIFVGSADERAAVWRSTDDGTTWKTILRDTAITADTNDFARFYFAGVLDGKLYVQARDYYGPMHPNSLVFDGASWTQGPDLFPKGGSSLGWRPVTIAGEMVYRGWEPGQSSPLRGFDGTTVRWIDSMWVRDHFVADGYLYALVDSGYGTITIKRTRDLRTWERMGRVPFECHSLAVLDGTFYLGTINSEILEYVGPRLSGIEVPLHADASLVVRPIPASNELRMDVGGVAGTIRVVDGFGRIVMLRAVDAGSASIHLDVRDIAPGVYHVLFGSQRTSVVIAR